MGGRGREQAHADELEEADVIALRHPVDAIQQLVGDVRERFHERDARIGHVVVGPLRDAPLDEALGIVHQVLEAPVVEVGGREAHRAGSSGMT